MKKLLLFIVLLTTQFALAQSKDISGNVTDDSGAPMVGVNVIEKGTSNGTVTDIDGNFSLEVQEGAILLYSFIGFDTQEVPTDGSSVINVILQEGLELDDVVITGNRSRPRTILNSPVPIDVIKSDEILESGKPILDRILTYTVPSFNSQNQAISDATAHFDPADLRNLGPSRTLVLINGKRKNQSAQLYLNRTPGKGELGVDLKSIPVAAIESVEILRDGASAQYGSDAVAGVINFIIKKDVEYSTFSTRTGITSQRDGFNFAADYNTALKIGDTGFANITVGYYSQNITNRAGEPGIGDLPDDARPNEIAFATANPTIGMIVGQPQQRNFNLFVNMANEIDENGEFYLMGGLTTRKGRSYAFYRAPWWRRDVADADFLTPSPSSFIGYHPTFDAEINDYFNSAGIKYDLGNDLNVDASITYGGNRIFYEITNTVNRDYLADHGTSPRVFQPGGYSFQNLIGNLDFVKVFNDEFSISFGGELKYEFFQSYRGDQRSYYGAGSDSFAGIKPSEVVSVSRNNIAFYASGDWDISDDFLISAAGRFENYSDAGSNFSYKFATKYSVTDDFIVRGSFNTGFRAPALAQTHLINSQFIIVSGSSEPLLQGTLANNSPVVQGLGVPSLFPETSRNFSFGGTLKVGRKFSASLDLYNIKVNDRVLLSSQITGNGSGGANNPVPGILDTFGVTAVQFFINAGNTNTNGLDLVLNYKTASKFSVNLAVNLNKTDIDAITTPDILADNGYDIFNRQEQVLLTRSRPRSKYILNLRQSVGKWDIGLVNTRFGQVTIAGDGSGANDQTLTPKIATDINLRFNITTDLAVDAFINNIFDVYPDITNINTGTTSGGRFLYSSQVQQLGQLGTNFNVGLTYKF